MSKRFTPVTGVEVRVAESEQGFTVLVWRAAPPRGASVVRRFSPAERDEARAFRRATAVAIHGSSGNPQRAAAQ
jgi:hypothetical protein